MLLSGLSILELCIKWFIFELGRNVQLETLLNHLGFCKSKGAISGLNVAIQMVHLCVWQQYFWEPP